MKARKSVWLNLLVGAAAVVAASTQASAQQAEA
jgi:hypothetical protein